MKMDLLVEQSRRCRTSAALIPASYKHLNLDVSPASLLLAQGFATPKISLTLRPRTQSEYWMLFGVLEEGSLGKRGQRSQPQNQAQTEKPIESPGSLNQPRPNPSNVGWTISFQKKSSTHFIILALDLSPTLWILVEKNCSLVENKRSLVDYVSSFVLIFFAFPLAQVVERFSEMRQVLKECVFRFIHMRFKRLQEFDMGFY